MFEVSLYGSYFGAELEVRRLLTSALALVFCIALMGTAFAKEPNTQYANISPLPGAGVALNSEGRIDGLGALQINIPVAYTPGWGFVNLGVFEGCHIGQHDFDNGSNMLGVGFGTWPRLYVSAMGVSSILLESKAVNAQLGVVREDRRTPAVAFGYQDILRKEIGQRSAYGVATKELTISGRPIFATLGYGGGRFINSPFGGLSAPIGESLNLAIEWDGFQMNEGVGWRPGGRSGKVTFLGAYNGRAGFLAGVSLATWFTR